MKKTIFLWLLLIVLVMFGLPFLAVRFVGGDAAMPVCWLLFFAINPLFSVFIGTLSGKKLSARWLLPILSPILFVLAAWVIFDVGEKDFLIYGAVYLAIGVVAAIVSAVHTAARKKKEKAAAQATEQPVQANAAQE